MDFQLQLMLCSWSIMLMLGSILGMGATFLTIRVHQIKELEILRQLAVSVEFFWYDLFPVRFHIIQFPLLHIHFYHVFCAVLNFLC